MADWKMEKEGVYCEIDGPVALFKVNRPQTKNGMDWKAKGAQAEAYERIAADPDVRVMVITAEGEYFITGGRVDASKPEEQRLYSEYIARVENARKTIKVPMIAAVNGHCFKGGMGLVAQADLAVAKDTATFSFPEVRMGGVPMVVMARCMGYLPKKLALEAYYSNREYPAKRMYEVGFLNAVTDEEHFWPTVEEYIHMVIDYPRSLIQMTHDAYYAMEGITDLNERVAFSQKWLAEKVLPQMAKEKTSYNV